MNNCPKCGVIVAKDWAKCGMCGELKNPNPEMTNEDHLKEAVERIKNMVITAELHPDYNTIRIAELIRKECEQVLAKISSVK